jgi:hypothetical protein
MSWTTNDKEKICFYLGMPHTQENYNLIQQRMDDLQNLSIFAVDTVQSYLTEIEQIEGEIEGVRDNVPTGSFDELFNPLKLEARRWCKRVAIALNLSIANEVF